MPVPERLLRFPAGRARAGRAAELGCVLLAGSARSIRAALGRYLVVAVLVRLADEGSRVAVVLLALARTSSAAFGGALIAAVMIPHVGVAALRARQSHAPGPIRARRRGRSGRAPACHQDRHNFPEIVVSGCR